MKSETNTKIQLTSLKWDILSYVSSYQFDGDLGFEISNLEFV